MNKRSRAILLEEKIREMMVIASENGLFLRPADPAAWAIYNGKGVKIFPKSGGTNLWEIGTQFAKLPSQNRVDDWGDPVD
jgi:hypothetical protein